MSLKDNRRNLIWWFLAIIAALQLYVVRELLAVFALFALGFAVLAGLVSAGYLVQKGWESGLSSLAASRNPLVLATRRSVAVAEDWARRPIRRPDSQPVS
jgi:hypothetical protein